MSVAVDVAQLLDYSDHERRKWLEWIEADRSRLQLSFQAGGRFPSLWSLLDHIVLVERRHLARLCGATPPESTGVATGDVKALFEFAALVRADLRRYVADLDEDEASQVMTIVIGSNTFTMTRRRLLTHIILHEVRHFAQIAATARAAGLDPPGEHDLFYFPGFP
jgi:uncharacterized damage-inducible protein DinB